MGGKCSTRTRKQRGGGACSSCGCNSSSTNLYGGYMYGRKASLASRKRLLNRLTNSKTRRKQKRKRKRKSRRNKHRRGRR